MELPSATTSSESLRQRFSALARDRRKALVTYVTAGHPTHSESVRLLRALEGAGADVLEVGVPFSDPLADGPVIQHSSQVALAQGMTLDASLALVREARLMVPVVLFSYLNPVVAAGPDVLARAAANGIQGILITDLPVGADPERERWLGSGPLAFVRLVAPTTPDDRMREIGAQGAGFIYLISRLGVTGARDDIATELPATIARLRRVVDLPICVGFGVSTAAQARRIGALADGVVVGSAIVRAANESVQAAADLTGALRRALDEP